jgi:hypothetical protein
MYPELPAKERTQTFLESALAEVVAGLFECDIKTPGRERL